MLLLGISFVITQFCPIVTLSPIFTGPIIFVPAPMKTLFPIVAAPIIFLCPIKTPGYKVQFSPIFAAGFMIIGPQCQIVIPFPQTLGGI